MPKLQVQNHDHDIPVSRVCIAYLLSLALHIFLLLQIKTEQIYIWIIDRLSVVIIGS